MKLISLFIICCITSTYAAEVTLCDANTGLKLINSNAYSASQIEMILNACDKVAPNSKQVLLLHGLLARNNKQYNQAIEWFKQALNVAPEDSSILLELATTYEKDKQLVAAEHLYQQIIQHAPLNRSAQLGLARLLRIQNQDAPALKIYQHLLQQDEHDVDALNGLGWINTAKNNLNEAQYYFEQVVKIQPQNTEALEAIKNIRQTQAQQYQASSIKMPVLCDADQGLLLLNQQKPPIGRIEHILKACDKNTPNATSALLLHGLLQRYLGRKTQDYSAAIPWLERAATTAAPGNYAPKLELAVTYEWMNQFPQALFIYDDILKKAPNNIAALLGKAQILGFSYQIKPAFAIYKHLLQIAPKNVDVLNGLGETYLMNYQFKEAKTKFDQTLAIDPKNLNAQHDLELLDNATKNILEMTLGHYVVPPNSSEGLNLYYFRNLNATDSMTVYATHNTRQIQSGFGEGSALLPNNSVLLGYQHSIPNQYGWQLSYDSRQHNALPFENRVYGAGNLYLNRNLEWFGGTRLAFPDLWNTQLLISGFTAYTPLPVNFTLTGFWAFQQIGGYNSSYSLDLSKEYSSHLFYDFGPSYLIEQASWEIHGKLIVPILKNQAIVVQGSHYMFNNSTFATAGWRIYWA